MLFVPTRSAALGALAAFLPEAGRRYQDARNHDDGPDRTNVSRLSPWLHAGLIAEHEVLAQVLEEHGPQAADKFISEVFWRIYFKGYLEQRPSIWRSFCCERDKALAEVEHDSGLKHAYDRATSGQTGIAAFDCWALELMETGYLHNHARMWFASIWMFTLKLDWTLGADWFLRHLIDGDAASNTLSWRWVAGLHTQGKSYLGTAENIARFTARHPQGPLSANGLAQDAEALTEKSAHTLQDLALPQRVAARHLPAKFALLLHDEAASHGPLRLQTTPDLVIGAARPKSRSAGHIGALPESFARQAISFGVADAADAFACPPAYCSDEQLLSDMLDAAGLEHIVMPYLPVGWTRDALWPQIAALTEQGRLTVLLPELQRAVWPHAKAGFYGVEKVRNQAMRDAGLAATG